MRQEAVPEMGWYKTKCAICNF